MAVQLQNAVLQAQQNSNQATQAAREAARAAREAAEAAQSARRDMVTLETQIQTVAEEARAARIQSERMFQKMLQK